MNLTINLFSDLWNIIQEKGGEKNMYQSQTIGEMLANFLTNILNFFPQLIAGLLILIIGLLVGNIVSRLFLGLFKVFSPEKIFKDNKVIKAISVKAWLVLLAQIIRWSIIIMFLVAALEAWGLREVGRLLNQYLLYLPNVVIAVFMGFIGVVIAGLAQDLVKHSAKGLGSSSVGTLSSLAYYSVVVFTGLIILNQLGVAADLIKILFTGVVVMIALAGGLAFGLGGQDAAKKILNEVLAKFSGEKE